MLNKELMLRGNAMKQKQNLTSFQKAGIASLKKKQEEYRLRMKQARAEKDRLYEVYALGEINGMQYQQRSDELAEQISLLSVKADDAASKLAVLESEYQKAEEDMKQIIRYSHIETLTQDVVDTFIKKVYVYKDKRVEIEWNFVSI
jgi:predicted nuclease with TOPRIM domain